MQQNTTSQQRRPQHDQTVHQCFSRTLLSVWLLVGPGCISCYVHLTLCSKLHLLSGALTIATSVSRASLIKWFRTLRSQIGLSGDCRPGRDHSKTINSKASSPDKTDTQIQSPRGYWRAKLKQAGMNLLHISNSFTSIILTIAQYICQ